jgi:hypothetical protein
MKTEQNMTLLEDGRLRDERTNSRPCLDGLPEGGNERLCLAAACQSAGFPIECLASLLAPHMLNRSLEGHETIKRIHADLVEQVRNGCGDRALDVALLWFVEQSESHSGEVEYRARVRVQGENLALKHASKNNTWPHEQPFPRPWPAPTPGTVPGPYAAPVPWSPVAR